MKIIIDSLSTTDWFILKELGNEGWLPNPHLPGKRTGYTDGRVFAKALSHIEQALGEKGKYRIIKMLNSTNGEEIINDVIIECFSCGGGDLATRYNRCIQYYDSIDKDEIEEEEAIEIENIISSLECSICEWDMQSLDQKLTSLNF